MSKKEATIGGRIRHFRNLRGKTPQELADAIGRDTSSIYKIETGKQELYVTQLQKIAEALNVSNCVLLNDKEPANEVSSQNNSEQEFYKIQTEYFKSQIECNKQFAKTLLQNHTLQIATTSPNKGL